MAIGFHTGFEAGLPAELSEQIVGANEPASVTLASTTPNSGTYCRRANLAANDISLVHIAMPHTTLTEPVTVGCAFRIEDLSSVDSIILAVCEASGTYLDGVALFINPDGSANVKRGYFSGSNQPSLAGAVIEGSTLPSGTFVSGEWYYVEIHAVFHSSTGTVRVDVNGVERYNLTGLDLDNAPGTLGDGAAASLHLSCDGKSPAIAGDWDLDDIYLAVNESGPLGMQQHEALVPTSSVESDGVGSDGNSVDNYQLVDEIPFSSADYVDMSTAADRERYGLADRTLTGDVTAVTLRGQVWNPDGGTITANGFVYSGTTEADGDSLILGASASGVLALAGPYDEDPDTAAAWGTAGVNALTAGAEVVSVA